MANLSPMMKQYFEIKEQNKDCILFFRLGDFYEMFYEDAEIASRELELTLTGRDCGQEKRAPMCGVPFHSCEGYIAKLVEKGYNFGVRLDSGDISYLTREVRKELDKGSLVPEIADHNHQREEEEENASQLPADGDDRLRRRHIRSGARRSLRRGALGSCRFRCCFLGAAFRLCHENLFLSEPFQKIKCRMIDSTPTTQQ